MNDEARMTSKCEAPVPKPLDYQPRDQVKPEPISPSDRAGWAITGIIIFFILAYLGMFIT